MKWKMCWLNAEGKWKVWVTTNDLPSAGTQAQVTLAVYGHRGCTKPIPLGSADGQTFQAGNVDEFQVCASLMYTFGYRYLHVINQSLKSCMEARMRKTEIVISKMLSFILRQVQRLFRLWHMLQKELHKKGYILHKLTFLKFYLFILTALVKVWW